MLTLESTSVCNLRCVMCPQATGGVHRPKHLEPLIIEKLAEPLATVERIQLHGIGEPLFSPAFWRTLEHLRGGNATAVSFNTNFTILTDEQIEKLLQAHLHGINVSLDAATPETHAKIREYDFHKVIANIKRFLSRRNALGLKSPRLFINMTLMHANIDELPDLVRLGHELGVDEVRFWQMNAGQDYKLEREGWTFDYCEQMLVNHPALSNRRIKEAIAVAKELGVDLGLDPNKDIYFPEPA